MPRLNELLGRSKNGDAARIEPRASNLERLAVDDANACPTCHGGGFVRQDLPVSHPEFGKAVPCRCVENEGRETRLARLQRYSNLGPLNRLTFENLVHTGRSPIPRDRERFQRCVAEAEAFSKDPSGWMVLVGAPGCGKTHIAVAIANRCIATGIPAFFVVVPDLLDHLRAAYRPDADLSYDQFLEQVRSAPVLILDDLGTHSATPWAEEKLFQIINDRFNTRLPTVITTNVDLRRLNERLRARLGDPDMPQPHADPIARVHILEEPLPQEWNELSMLDLPEIRDMTFEAFDLSESRSPRDRDLRTDAHRHALGFANAPKGWMLLANGRERDRTHLLAAVANQRRRVGEFPLLVRVSQLLEFLRNSMYGDDHDYDYYRAKKNLRAWPLLLLDDLEIGMGSEYARRELFELLYWRYLAQLPTVISTPAMMTKLLSDPGWNRLAGLMKNAAGFCSEVPVGEEEQDATPKGHTPPRLKKSSGKQHWASPR